MAEGVKTALGRELGAGDEILAFREAPKLPHWVNAGLYVLDDESLARLPERVGAAG